MADAKRDNNNITTLLGVSNVDGITPVTLWADPVTHRLLVSSIGGTVGPGTINELAYFNTTTAVASLSTATYPSLTEISYVKGVTSSIQTQLNAKGVGTVTSVAMSVPTGLTISGSPITSSGTLAVALDTGYVIPLQSTIDGKANLALSNLASVAINTSLISDTDSTDDLGSATIQWANVYTDRLISSIADLVIENDLLNGDISFKVNDGGVDTTVMTLDGATSFVGIGTGTTTPAAKLEVATDGASNVILSSSYGTTGSDVLSTLNLYTARGTMASPTATQSGDVIGRINFQGFDTARETGARIEASADAEWGTAGDTTDAPTNITFWTAPDGSATLVERFRISSNGASLFSPSISTGVTIASSSGSYAGTLLTNTISGRGDTTAYNFLSMSNTAGSALLIKGDRTIVAGGGLIDSQHETTPILRMTSTDTSLTGASELLGSLQFYASDASTNNTAVFGKIEVTATDTGAGWGANAARTDMRFFTTTAGTMAEKMRITQAGNIGIGVGSVATTDIGARLHAVSTTEQLRLGYDTLNYLSATIGSTGSATLALTGTSPTFTFSQDVTLPKLTTTSTIELGHATDTTISRVSAGVIAVEGVTVPTISSTSTLTNKRITQRVVTTTDDATAVIDIDTTDVYELSAIANNTTFSTTGTPTDGQKLVIRWKDAGVSKTITWDAVFVAIGITLPTSSTAGKWQYVGCQYNSGAAKWHAIALSTQA